MTYDRGDKALPGVSCCSTPGMRQWVILEWVSHGGIGKVIALLFGYMRVAAQLLGIISTSGMASLSVSLFTSFSFSQDTPNCFPIFHRVSPCSG